MLIEVILTVGVIVCALLVGAFLLLRPYFARATRNIREEYEREVLRDQIEERRRKERTAQNTEARAEVEESMRGPTAGGEGEERIDER